MNLILLQPGNQQIFDGDNGGHRDYGGSLIDGGMRDHLQQLKLGKCIEFNEYCLRAKPLGQGAKEPTFLYIMRNAGDKVANIITLELRDAMISEIQFQSHPDDQPTEQFKLNFTEIIWTATAQNAGTAAEKFRSGWSLARNRPIDAFTD